jgi:hypothetical protein
VSRFRVPALPSVRSIRADELDALIEPVTRERTAIERAIRQAAVPEAPPVPAMPDRSGEEGLHGW